MTKASEYEIILLLSPSLSEKEASEDFERILTEKVIGEGKVTFRNFWGLKKLAYPIRKEDSAWYMTACFIPQGRKIKEAEEELRIDRNILRHLISRVDDNCEKMTLAEIGEWNAKNIPQETSEEEADDIIHAPIRKKPASKEEILIEESISLVQEKPLQKAKSMNRDEIDKKIDELLEGELEL